MARKGLNIYKRKDGRWEGRYRKNCDKKDRIKYGYIYGKTYREVREKLYGITDSEKTNVCLSKDITYAQLLQEWLEYIKLNVKESSHSRYSQTVNTHLVPGLGSCKISQLSQFEINRFLLGLQKNGRKDNRGGLSAKSVADIASVIKSTIHFANAKGYCEKDSLKLLPIKQKPQDARVLSAAEQSALNRVLTENTDCTKFGVLLSLYTGMRLGEVCALKWENIDTDSGIIHVCFTMQRIKNTDENSSAKTKIIISTPKSQKSVRDIPMPQFLTRIARELKKESGAYVLTGYADRFIEPRIMQNRFKKYLSLAGLENINYHCLRHTFATRCMELGFDVKTLSEILGHSNVTITLNRYVHSSLETKKREMEKLVI